MDMIVDGLLHDMYALILQDSGYLCRGPIVFYYHLIYPPPELCRLTMVAFKTMTARVALTLRI